MEEKRDKIERELNRLDILKEQYEKEGKEKELRGVEAEIQLKEAELEVEKLGGEELERKVEYLRLLKMLLKENPDFKSLGQGVHKGKFYCGSALYSETTGDYQDIVITDSGEAHVGKRIKEDFGLDYRSPFDYESLSRSWSTSTTPYSISAFIEGKVPQISTKEVVKELLAESKRCFFHSNELEHFNTVLLILNTYIYQISDKVARGYIGGDFDAGKTKLSTFIEHYAFHSISGATLSHSHIYRTVEATGGTVVIDDIDDLPEEERAVLRRLSKTGYSRHLAKTGKTDRKIKGKLAGSTHSFYGPLFANGTVDMDSITQSRTITTNMEKTSDEAIKNSYPKFDQRLRDKIYCWGLQNALRIKEISKGLSSKHLSGRDLEIVLVPLSIAKDYSEELFPKMEKFYSEKIKDQHATSSLGDRFVSAMEWILQEWNPEEEEFRFIVKNMSEGIAKAVYGEFVKPEKIHAIAGEMGKKLAKYPSVFDRKNPKNKSTRIVKRENFVRFLVSRKFTESLELPEKWEGYFYNKEALTSLTSLTNPNNTNNPNITNLSTPPNQDKEKSTDGESGLGVRGVRADRGDRANE